MGRRDFRPARVYQTAQRLLGQEFSSGLVPKGPIGERKVFRYKNPTPWYTVVGEVPVSESLVRTQPVQHLRPVQSRKVRKPSKMFKPQQISYADDKRRTEFFQDHPWELARPRLVLEDDGKDYRRWDWSKAYEPGRPINGESVIQRQLWLMSDKIVRQPDEDTLGHWPMTEEDVDQSKPTVIPGLSKDKAYDQARKEFYDIRHRHEVESRVAREEAMSTGGFFGSSANEVGMELENKTFEQWRTWAEGQVVLQEQMRNSAYTGSGQGESTGLDELEKEGAAESSIADAAVEEVKDSVPGSKRGQTAVGGAPFHP